MTPPERHSIQLEGLVKSFDAAPSNAIDGITTNIVSGTITGLVGPDGAG